MLFLVRKFDLRSNPQNQFLKDFSSSENTIIVFLWIVVWVQNPATGDALTKLQNDVDETKIILVSILLGFTLQLSVIQSN
jgi:hypothetical protein